MTDKKVDRQCRWGHTSKRKWSTMHSSAMY